MRVHFVARQFALGFLCFVLPAMAQIPVAKPDDFHTLPPVLRSQCVQSLQTRLPDEANTAPVRPMFGDVHSMELYYGLGDQVRDYVAARHLAWGERAADPRGYGASLMLAMIYANGLGTPRNPALALRMACESTAYSTMSTEDLEQFALVLHSQAQPLPQYDICNPEKETPSAVKNLCPVLADARARQQWSDRLKEISTGWTPEQRQKLDLLKHASRFFLRMNSPDEDSLKKLEDMQLQQIGEMEAGRVPATTQMRAAEADAQLNEVYRKLMDQHRAPSQELGGALPPVFEHAEELHWVQFRDAWMDLMASRYPKLDANRWKTQLIVERTQTLERKAEMLPPVDPGAKDWLATCAQYRDTPLPQEIRAVQTPSREACSSAASYYGLGTPVDYAEARRCAILERSDIEAGWGGNTGGPVSGLEINGPATLAMIYANGNGVARNTALAMRFTCEAIDAGVPFGPGYSSPDNPEEDKTIFRTLIADVAATGVKTQGQSQASFDICNYLGGDRAATTCEYIERLRNDLRRKADMDSFAAKFNPEQKAAYRKLVAAFEVYLNAHNENETSVMGHSPVSAAWVHQPGQEQAFIENMRRFETGDLPSHTAAEYAAADRDLNAAYTETMQTAGRPNPQAEGSLPPPENLRDTERLWLVYRDAWVAFGRLRYPRMSNESWLTWATLQRVEDLKSYGEVIP